MDEGLMDGELPGAHLADIAMAGFVALLVFAAVVAIIVWTGVR